MHADKKERDPTFRKQPKDIAASMQIGLMFISISQHFNLQP